MYHLDFVSLTQIFSVFIPVHLSRSLPWCLEGTLLLHVCTWGIQVFRPPAFMKPSFQPFYPIVQASHFLPVQTFVILQKRSSCISWVSGVRSSNKLLGQEPKKNHLASIGWRGSGLQNLSQRFKRFWAKMSGRNENSTFRMDMKWESQRKRQIFLSHCVKGLCAEDITSWMHIRSRQQSLSSINLILEHMITAVDYLNKAMVGKQEREIKEKRFCCKHLYHHHPNYTVV